MSRLVLSVIGIIVTVIFYFLPWQTAAAAPNFSEITKQAATLPPKLLHLGYVAYQHAKEQGFNHAGIVTLIDYSLPDTVKRLWVIDYKDKKVLFHTWAAQGKGTGLKYAKHFSNQPGTHATSIGVYRTSGTYVGKHGLSVRLVGLDPKFNGNALERAIVVHSAWYVSKQFIDTHGYLGRSWGCVALDKKVAIPLIHTIKDNTLLIAYYPNQTWLAQSEYLQPV